MSAIIIFKGAPDPWHPVDSTGFNGTGYITNSGEVIRPRRSRIAHTKLEAISRLPHQITSLSKHPRVNEIEQLFTKNVISNMLYVAAMQALHRPESEFWDHPIKLPILRRVSEREHLERWNEAMKVLRTGDLIFTSHTTSIISWLIRYFEQGTWSHVATYLRNGRIVEAISEGVVERSIEAYRSPHYRLGVYRIPHLRVEQLDAMHSFQRSQVGKKYSYRKVLTLGARLLVGIRPTTATKHTGPNALIIRGNLELITTV